MAWSILQPPSHSSYHSTCYSVHSLPFDYFIFIFSLKNQEYWQILEARYYFPQKYSGFPRMSSYRSDDPIFLHITVQHSPASDTVEWEGKICMKVYWKNIWDKARSRSSCCAFAIVSSMDSQEFSARTRGKAWDIYIPILTYHHTWSASGEGSKLAWGC